MRNYLAYGMIVASSLLAVVPGCRDSAIPKNTSAQSIVGKWIQEMASQPSVMQTEFFKDGMLRVLKYTVLPESTIEQLKSRGVDVGAMKSLVQPRRKLTYYAINTVSLVTGKVLAARPLTGTWSIEDGILVQTFTSEVFGKTETRFQVKAVSGGEMVLSSDVDLEKLVYTHTAQDKWEQATGRVTPWMRLDDAKGSIYSQAATPLHKAAEAGRKGEIESLLAGGADVNAKESGWGATPLHKASEAGHTEVVRILISRGADVNARTMGNWTPLHKAACEGHKEVVEVLLKNGARTDIEATLQKWTALQFAVERKHGDVAELIRRHMGKPDDAVAYFNIGNAHDKNGLYADAIAAYKKALAIKPDIPRAHNNMGAVYHKIGQHAEAIAAYRKAIAIKPDYPDAYVNMGLVHHKLGQYAEAITVCKKAIAIKPDYADAYFNMGGAYAALKQYTLAVTALEKGIAIDPTGKRVAWVRKGIRMFRRK